VNTEITDIENNQRRNWVCYDAECALCVRWANRFRGLLKGHGFGLIPLQSPEVRAALKIPRDELLAEMRVVTSDGHVFGGADALLYITRTICPPMFELARIPGIKPLLRTLYRFVARNRTCITGACAIAPTTSSEVGNTADWLPLVILPPAVAAIGTLLPAWLDMWLIAFALFAGCKWLCYRRELAKTPRVPWTRKAGFLLGWIGMDTASFAEDKPPTIPRPIEWLFALSKILIGATLIWTATRPASDVNWLLGGWTGMLGIILVLHFGLFHLLALTWRMVGIPVIPLMRAPLLSRSVGEFWAERWNTAFNHLATRLLFRPFRRMFGLRAATMLVFLVSGLIHDLVISVPARGGYGLPTLYFLLQGAAILFERTNFARRCGFNRGLPGRLFTIIVTAGPVFWLFHPFFVHNVILPFLKAIGAT
jgi:alginate O-acetyltransferase complex protein AlgI